MGLKLYNTLTRKKESFEPVDPSNVRMYVCGPTVYQRIHIGNARPLIVFDVLFRLLRHLYGEKHVTYVRNITDIDDKIIAQASKNGESIESLTERTTGDFLADADALGCLRPTHQPRATEHIAEMQAMIARLIAQGHAYAADGHVLFNVPSMPSYGRLSGRNRDDQIAGARVEVAPYKRDPADFILWKPSTPDQPGWDSPWGRGRPGWHIECSAMSERFLGAPFDIHGGGLDLIFPHHENEIAQSCCVHELDRMANYWVHNGFVDMAGEKMSKSIGNVLRVDEALRLVPGEAIRWCMLGTHYRQPIDLNVEVLSAARSELDRFYGALFRIDPDGLGNELIKPNDDIVDTLKNDLNTPLAITILRRQLDDFNDTADIRTRTKIAFGIAQSALLLGVLSTPPRVWRQGGSNRAIAGSVAAVGRDAFPSEANILAMLAVRAQARSEKDFIRADQIRQELEKYGIIVEDGPNGTTWRLV